MLTRWSTYRRTGLLSWKCCSTSGREFDTSSTCSRKRMKKKRKMTPEERTRSDEIGRRLERRIAELKAEERERKGQERRRS